MLRPVKRKPSFWWPWILAVVLSGFCALQNGCVAVVAAGAGAGAVAYARGDLRANLNAPAGRAFEAARGAVAGLGFSEISATSDAVSGEIIARTAQDRRVQIQIKEVTTDTSGLSIRIGAFGDEKLSRRIYDEIRGRL